MKFLALIKDSLREAVDTWVLYVTLVLSGLLILLVASISYRPITVQEEVQQIPDQFNLVLGLVAPNSGASARIADFRQTNDALASEPWKGDYSFSLIFHMPTEDQAKKLAKQIPVGQMQDNMSKTLYWADFVDVDMDAKSDPLEVRYDVVTRGSTVRNIRDWVHEPTILFAFPLAFAHGSLESWVYTFEDRILNGMGSWACLLVGVILTAFFVPNMLRKGAIDMLLVKPIHRTTLLLYKYLGGLTFVFLNALVAVGGVYLVIGVRTGVWAPAVLLLVPAITSYFAILYAVSVLFGVLTRSPIVPIIATLGVWLLLWGFGWAYQDLTLARKGGHPALLPFGWVNEAPNSVKTAVDVGYAVLPRTKDIDVLMTKIIAGSLMNEADYKHEDFDKLPEPNWAVSLSVTLAFIAVMLGLACWRFAVKDY
jgi:ABC-type transport system involved in multi-copper enzyme maturation permease subunit